MDIYLIDESKNYTYHFVVNPLNNLSLVTNRRFKTVDIMNFGEVDIFKPGENIKEISFDTLFPVEYDSSYCRELINLTPNDTVSLIEYWQQQEAPVRLIVTDININELVTISKFSHEVRGGEVGDIYASLTFRNHREMTISTIDTSNSYYGGLNSRSDSSTSGDSSDTYTDGDTVKVTASALNVRDGPGTEYNILGVVYSGEQLTIFRQYDNWADTYWGDNGGYICLDYVTKV